MTIIESYASPARPSSPVVIMSAPTPSSRPQHNPAIRPTVTSGPPADAQPRIAPTSVHGVPTTVRSSQRLVLPARSPVGTAFDVIARLGTAITLAALLVVTATALGVVDDTPTPTGAATTGR